MSNQPGGRFDILIIDGDATDFADDLFCSWIRLSSMTWPEIGDVVELARRQGFSVVIYPLEVEGEAGELDAEA